MYVSFSMTGTGISNIHTWLRASRSVSFKLVCECVCFISLIFHDILQVIETYIHAQSLLEGHFCMFLRSVWECMYVSFSGQAQGFQTSIHAQGPSEAYGQITVYVCLRHTYIHTCSVAWDIHTYIHAQLLETYIHTLSAGTFNIHTYTLAWACQTYIHTYMLRVGLELRHPYIQVWSLARLPEVLPLTIQKKMN